MCVTIKILFKSWAILVPETQCVCPFPCVREGEAVKAGRTTPSHV